MEAVVFEVELVEKCRAGDEGAWRYLVEHYQDDLRVDVRRRLTKGVRDEQLVEEILIGVLDGLWDHDCRLLCRFDPSRGCLRTYLNELALEEARRHESKKRRRRAHEVPLGRIESPVYEQEGLSLEAMLEEFEERLTPKRKRFCESQLRDAPTGPEPKPVSSENLRKLKRRVSQDARDYVEGN